MVNSSEGCGAGLEPFVMHYCGFSIGVSVLHRYLMTSKSLHSASSV
jgi:hypothetical protein